MDKELYRKAIKSHARCNCSEVFAVALTHRPKPKNIEYTKKLKYGDDRLSYVNFYTRKDLKNTPKPLLLYIHGGGWVSGITEMRNPYIMNWVKLGFFACSVSYSYAPQKIFPYQIQQIFTAIDYMFDHAEENCVDMNNIVIAGESAGGYFISFVASCANNPQILDDLGIVFRNKDKLKIKALVSHCGAFDFERLTNPDKPQSAFREMDIMICSFFGMKMPQLREMLKSEYGMLCSPQFTKDFPPSFLAWCERDFLRYETFDQMKCFDELGVPYDSFKGEGIIGRHGFTIVTMVKGGRECLEKTLNFVLPYLPEYFTQECGQWKLKAAERVIN